MNCEFEGVPSFKWAKKLKEAGWPQDFSQEIYVYRYPAKPYTLIPNKNKRILTNTGSSVILREEFDAISAPTVYHMLSIMPYIVSVDPDHFPNHMSKFILTNDLEEGWSVGYWFSPDVRNRDLKLDKVFWGHFLPDAIAECLCWLAKNHYVFLGDINE